MTVGQHSLAELGRRLRDGCLLLRLGPLTVRVRGVESQFTAAIHNLYAEADAPAFDEEVADVTLQLRQEGPGLSRWLVDGQPTDKPSFTAPLTLANFEWALHHAVAMTLAPSLAFHGAVAAREDGRAVALIGVSGSGKSTLAAALVADGWKLVADEYLIFAPDGRVLPMPGLVTLKNEAIELIRARGGSLRFGTTVPHPERGTICQVASSRVAMDADGVQVAALIFPTFVPNEAAQLHPADQPTAFQTLVDQSHNRHILGPTGFRQLCAAARTPAWTLAFGDLDAALDAVRSTVPR